MFEVLHVFRKFCAFYFLLENEVNSDFECAFISIDSLFKVTIEI